MTYHDYEPQVLLARETWTGWKARAQLAPIPTDPDLSRLKQALLRAASISGPKEIAMLRHIADNLSEGDVHGALAIADDSAVSVHYRLWGVRAQPWT